ncbi:MAG: rhamnulokinase [Clostridium sp.]|nr:rhamnulokinase [Clostridium sp.]
MPYYVAIDLGATSGRTVLAAVDDGGRIRFEEVNRFPNHIVQVGRHLYWNILELYRNILEGLSLVARRGVSPRSIGIDTWGVDIAFVGKDGGLLGMPYSYRDSHTLNAPEQFFTRCPESEVYETTGIQVMEINTLFQLDTLSRNNDSALRSADKVLFIPDLLNYLLTGKKTTEYTIATTGQIVNARTRRIEASLIDATGLSPDLFSEMVFPGDTIGTLTPEIQRITGLGEIEVVAVGSHDTASAVAAIPAANRNFAFLSSGTWSLMGCEVDEPIITEASHRNNFTNEGGVNATIRFLKNICGMWLLERCRAEWGDTDYGSLIAEAGEAIPFRSFIDPDDPMFANPESMTDAIACYCRETGQPVPETRGQFVRAILESLALRYREVLEMLRDMVPFPIERLHIIGGGSRNEMLNQFTADALALEVVAGPTEATALGNIMVQSGLTRDQIAQSVETVSYLPGDSAPWDTVYSRYLAITEQKRSK